MLYVEELAEGIIQITNRGAWTMDTWTSCSRAILEHTEVHREPVYLLINITATTQMDEAAFANLITAPHFGLANIGLAILVGRRAQLDLARDVLRRNPMERDQIQLRMMRRLDDAIRVLLDRQVMDRIEGNTTYGNQATS